MQIRYKATGEVEHVSNDVGKFAVKTGLAEEVLPTPKPERVPSLGFEAREGAHLGADYQFPPYVFFNCPTCGVIGCVENPSAGFVVRHCGLAEKITSHARAKYDALMTSYKARSKRKPVSPTALVTSTALSDRVADPRILNHFGIKSKEQLILQAQSDAELARRNALLKK